MSTILSKLDLYESEKINITNALVFITCGNLLLRSDMVSAIAFGCSLALIVCNWVFAPKPKSKVDLSELDSIKDQVKQVHDQLVQTRMAIGFKAAR